MKRYQNIIEELSIPLHEGGFQRMQRLAQSGWKAARAARRRGEVNAPNPAADLAAVAAAKYDASMARRGGATPEEVAIGGQSWAQRLQRRSVDALSAARNNAILNFKHNRPFIATLANQGKLGGLEPHEFPDTERKRRRQQARAEFERKARSGDYGQDNKAALRKRLERKAKRMKALDGT